MASIKVKNSNNEWESVAIANVRGFTDVEPIVLTGDQSYGCAGALAGAYIDLYGDTISTNNLTNINYMFKNNTATNIPFDINGFIGVATVVMMGVFENCINLTSLPKIVNVKPGAMTGMFLGCRSLREIPEDICDTWDWSQLHTEQYAQLSNIFFNCNSLRSIPESLLKNLKTMTAITSYTVYYNSFYNCFSLHKITGLGVEQGQLDSAFYKSFTNCYACRELTFEVQEDSTPYTVEWRNQTIDLSDGFGYGYGEVSFLKYNSGITEDMIVGYTADTDNHMSNAAALTKYPDTWVATSKLVSPYGHSAAVKTINSLPDTSAYLATAGGTNTIKFMADSGKYFDGGVNALTEEEIAVATSKGWTVSLV